MQPKKKWKKRRAAERKASRRISLDSFFRLGPEIPSGDDGFGRQATKRDFLRSITAFVTP
jgi:hypothetical protein